MKTKMSMRIITFVLLVTFTLQACSIPLGSKVLSRNEQKGPFIEEKLADSNVYIDSEYTIKPDTPTRVLIYEEKKYCNKFDKRYETKIIKNKNVCKYEFEGVSAALWCYGGAAVSVGTLLPPTILFVLAAPLTYVICDVAGREVCKQKTVESSTDDNKFNETVDKDCFIKENLITSGNVDVYINGKFLDRISIGSDGSVSLNITKYPEIQRSKNDVKIMYGYNNIFTTTKLTTQEIHKTFASLIPAHLRIKPTINLEDGLTDGILQADEKGAVVVDVMNDGKGQAFGVKLAASGSFTGVSYDSTYEIGDMKPGETRSVRIPMAASLDLKDGKFDLSFQAKEQLGRDSLPLKLQPSIITKELDKPNLVLASFEWSDYGGHAQGNGNNIPENNETIELKVKVQNTGKGMAKGVSVGLKELSGAESVVSNAELGNIPSGGMKEGTLAVRLPKLYKPKGKDIPLTVTVADSRPIGISSSKTYNMQYQYNEPIVKIADVEILDGDPGTNSRGNMNHLLDQDEEVEVRVHLENSGTLQAEGVSISLATNKQGVRVTPAEVNLGTLPAGEKKRYASFSVDVPSSAIPGPIAFNLSVKQKDYAPLTAKLDRTVMEATIIGRPVPKPGSPSRPSLNLPVPENIDEVPYLADHRNNNAYAVVMGVGQYKKQGISPLSFAKADAEAVRNYLVNIGGFPKDNVKTITETDATLTEMRKYIKEWLSRRVDKNSLVVVYFSGHGVPELEKKAPYLLPYDGDPNAPKSTAYSITELKEDINSLPTKNVVIALDSCYSGKGRSATPQGVRGALWVEDDNTPTEAVMITASKWDQTSWDYPEKSHGLFTYYLLKGMRGKDTDANGDGYVDVDELFAYVKKEVPAVSRRIQPAEQTPVISGSGKGIKLTRSVQ